MQKPKRYESGSASVEKREAIENGEFQNHNLLSLEASAQNFQGSTLKSLKTTELQAILSLIFSVCDLVPTEVIYLQNIL